MRFRSRLGRCQFPWRGGLFALGCFRFRAISYAIVQALTKAGSIRRDLSRKMQQHHSDEFWIYSLNTLETKALRDGASNSVTFSSSQATCKPSRRSWI